MKLDLVKPGLAALAVLFLVLYLQECSRPRVDNSVEQENHELKERVAVLETGIHEVSDSLKQIKALRATENQKAQKDSSRSANQIARLSRGYSKAKQQVQELTDSTGRIQAYVQLTDSLLSAKDSLYTQEVNHRLAMERLHTIEIAELGQRNVLQVQVSEEYKARVEQLTNQNERLTRRLERKRKFNGVLLGLVGGLGAAVAVIAITD